MLKLKVIKAGTNKVGNWALVSVVMSGLIMTTIINTVEELKEEQEIEVPKQIAANLKWSN